MAALSTGIGVSNTRARLAHQFGAHYRFEFQRHADGFTVLVASRSVRIPGVPVDRRVRRLRITEVAMSAKTIRTAHRRRRAARARADALAARRRNGRRGGRRSPGRRRGRRGHPRPVARPRLPRRADAEARRLRGDPDRRRRADAGRSSSSPPTTSTRCAPSRCRRSTTCSSRSISERFQGALKRVRRQIDSQETGDIGRRLLALVARPQDRSAVKSRPPRRQVRRPALLPARRRNRLDRSGRQLRAAARRHRRPPAARDDELDRGAAEPGDLLPHPPLAHRQHRADQGTAALVQRRVRVILRNGARLTLSRGYREKLQERLGKPL